MIFKINTSSLAEYWSGDIHDRSFSWSTHKINSWSWSLSMFISMYNFIPMCVVYSKCWRDET